MTTVSLAPHFCSVPAHYSESAYRKATLSLPVNSRSFSPAVRKQPAAASFSFSELVYKLCILEESPSGISISLVMDANTRVEYVVKSSPRSLETEYSIQSSLAGPNITKTHGYFYDGKYHIVMEYCQRLDLFTYLEDKELTETEAKRLFRQLVEAVETCHSAQVAHLDIKPENCFIDANGVLKLGDFGFAKRLENGELVREYCGTVEYMSPEVHRKQPFEGMKADIFAAGKILFEMALGFCPFKVANLDDPNFNLFIRSPELYWERKRSAFAARGLPHDWNPQLLDLLEWMMSYHAGNRPSIQQVRNHSWLSQ